VKSAEYEKEEFCFFSPYPLLLTFFTLAPYYLLLTSYSLLDSQNFQLFLNHVFGKGLHDIFVGSSRQGFAHL